MSGTPVVLQGLDLAALLCSRVCHDLISPVGAIMNGLEVMEDDSDEEDELEDGEIGTSFFTSGAGFT